MAESTQAVLVPVSSIPLSIFCDSSSLQSTTGMQAEGFGAGSCHRKAAHAAVPFLLPGELSVCPSLPTCLRIAGTEWVLGHREMAQIKKCVRESDPCLGALQWVPLWCLSLPSPECHWD